MRKKLLLLALVLIAATVLTPGVQAGGTHACPICTTYADCSVCCVSCICDSSGQIIACTNHFCPPPDGPCEKG